MIILPAIDILGGMPVRLYKGDYGQKEVVGQDVLAIAKSFEQAGCSYIHMVDLDGAKSGNLENAKIICDVAKQVKVPVEVGGGIRSLETIDYYLNAGVARVILGTKALEDRSFLEEVVNRYGNRIVVGIDCKDGKVCGSGWLETSNVDYLEFAKDMETLGVKTIVFTDISKDGTLEGPNLDMLKQLKETVSIDIIASGGIKDLSHIQQLKELGVYGAITGKAIYAKTLDLDKALQVCKEEEHAD